MFKNVERWSLALWLRGSLTLVALQPRTLKYLGEQDLGGDDSALLKRYP